MARRTETVTESREVVTCDVCGSSQCVVTCEGCGKDACANCRVWIQTPLHDFAFVCRHCKPVTKFYATGAKEQRLLLERALKKLDAEWRAACRAGRKA